jgi:GcrA cell cycle regulator
MTTWTDERIEELIKLHHAGLSYADIARRLGNGITRNAALGKAFRMGLRVKIVTRTQKRLQQARKAAVAYRKAQRKPYTPQPPTRPVEDVQPVNLVTFEDMTPEGCKWMYGDPRKGGGFCPQTRINGLPYCEAHRLRAYEARQVKPRHAQEPHSTRQDNGFGVIRVVKQDKVEA